MDIRESITSWTGSNHYKEFRRKLEFKMTLLRWLDKHIIMKNKTSQLTKKELEATLDSIIMFDELPLHEKESYLFTAESFYSSHSKSQVIFEFIRALTNWLFYLSLCIDEEEYELAQKLQQVIMIEKRECEQAIEKYCIDFLEEDAGIIEEIYVEIRNKFGI